MPQMADMTSAARSPPETPPGPAWVRASTPAGWRPPRPTRRRRGRPGHPGCRMPGRCGLSDRVARRPKSRRRHPQLRAYPPFARSEEHTSELQSRGHLVCRLLLEKKKNQMLPAVFIAAETLHHHLVKRKPFLTSKRVLAHQTLRNCFKYGHITIVHGF